VVGKRGGEFLKKMGMGGGGKMGRGRKNGGVIVEKKGGGDMGKKGKGKRKKSSWKGGDMEVGKIGDICGKYGFF
jgi:hypothetical protein